MSGIRRVGSGPAVTPQHALRAESKELLGRYGVPLADERLAATAGEAVAAADELGYPVVAKLCGDAIAHKTERGLVRLGLGDAAAVRGRGRASCSPRPRADDGEVERARRPDGPGAPASSSPGSPTTRSSA